MFAPLVTKPQPASKAASRVLQRKCACGAAASSLEMCPACAGERSGLQRKFAIGASNDPLEREADRVADQVMAGPSRSDFSRVPVSVQRHTPTEAQRSQNAPPSVDRALAMPGRPLDAALRRDMETRFGHDFSQVRVHQGAAAEQSARDVAAHAYTVGSHIVFGAAQYDPATPAGRRLLAHELTHTIQQGPAGGTAGGVVRRAPVGAPGGPTPDQAGNPLPYREATELATCMRIMKDEEYCRHEVLGEPMPVPTLSLSNDSYDDKPTESRKKIGFDVSLPKSADPKNYALVNHLKGFQKAGDGTFFKVEMYGSTVDFNFPAWQVDSKDTDPVYWSKAGTRWNYVLAGSGFTATDNPGPALSTETGAVYAVNFKIGLYRLADLPATTSGQIKATALDEKAWQYSVKVGPGGAFTHPAI